MTASIRFRLARRSVTKWFLALGVLTIVLLASPGHGILSAFADGLTGTPAPSVVSDQPDYVPGSLVTLTGANWPANDPLQISVTDSSTATWSFADTVTTDLNGTFTEYVTLPDWFVATYSVSLTDGIGNSATTTFTDAVKLKITGVDGQQYSPPNVENLSSHISGSALTISCPTGFEVSATGLGSSQTTSWQVSYGAAAPDTPGLDNSVLSAASTFASATGTSANGSQSCVGLTINLSGLNVGQTYIGSLVVNRTSGAAASPADYYFTFTMPSSVNTTTSLVETTGTNPSTYGSAVVVKASVTAAVGPNPSGVGMVTFFNGASSISGCTNVALIGSAASCSLPVLDVSGSPYNLTAKFSGTASGTIYNGSTSSGLALAISPLGITITANNQTYTFGDAATTPGFGTSGYGTGSLSVTCSTSYVKGDGVADTSETTSCSDVNATDNTNYSIGYKSGTVAISPAKLKVTASSPASYTFGGPTPSITPSYLGFVNGDGVSSLTTKPTCQIVGAIFTGTLLNAGPYSTACSGAVDSNYTFGYVNGSLTVSKAATSLLYTGQQLVLLGNNFVPSSTLSSSVNACSSSESVTYSLDLNPLTGANGTYLIGPATTDSNGNSALSVSTTGWLENVYTVTATFAGTTNCVGTSYAASLTVASAGDAANGGGWYTLPGVGRTNFGFTVHKVPNTTNTYKGEMVSVSTYWRFKGTLTTYGTVSSGGVITSGSASGTGDLYWWNATLNNGLGGWQLVQSGLSVTINFTPTSTGKKASPGSFGWQIVYSSPLTVTYPLPTSLTTALKGGNVNAS